MFSYATLIYRNFENLFYMRLPSFFLFSRFFIEKGVGHFFSFLWVWLSCFSFLICTEIWIWFPIGDFWWVVLSVFLSEGGILADSLSLPRDNRFAQYIKISLFWQNDLEIIDFSIKMIAGKSGFQNFFRYKGVDENWKI